MGVSDDSVIFGCRKISIYKNPPKIVDARNYKCYNTLEFSHDLLIALSNFDWATDDPNELWKQFSDMFKEVADLHAQIRQRIVRSKYAPWLNGKIKNLMNYRDNLKRRAVKTNSSYLHETYKIATKNVNKLISNKKAKYFQDVINKSKSNPKEMWRNINQLIGKNV